MNDKTLISPGGSPGGRHTLRISVPGEAAVLTDQDSEPVAPAGRVVLASAPKIRAVYWCRFWRDALRPEFYKKRPVVILSRDNRLDGPALVVPLTTKPQATNKWAYKLSENPNPRKPALESLAVCNHIYLVSCARLEQMDSGVPRMQQHDFDEVVRLMLRALPNPPLEAR